MPAIVDYPTVVKEVLDVFGSSFANEPERRHFAEYLTGLILAQKKNVSAINREFAVTTDQSCLNRWLTEAVWDEEALNLQRIEWLQKSRETRFSARGVIPIDNVLVDHTGKLIEDVGYFWDRPRLPDRQLRLHVGQALSPGVLSLRQTRAMRAARDRVSRSQRSVPPTDRLGDRQQHRGGFHLRQLVHPQGQSQLHSRSGAGLCG
jgi:hypothetical protein